MVEIIIPIVGNGIIVTLGGMLLKSKLATKNEELKGDIKKESELHSMYKSKKHEAYNDVYRGIMEADGYIRGIRNQMIKTPLYKNLTLQEINSHAEEHGATHLELSRIEKLYNEEDFFNLSIKVEQIKKRKAIKKAESKLIDANNILYYSRVYLNDDVFSKAKNIKDDLFAVYRIYDIPGDVKEDREETDKILKDVNDNEDDLLTLVKQDLINKER